MVLPLRSNQEHGDCLQVAEADRAEREESGYGRSTEPRRMTIPADWIIWNAQQCADFLDQSRQEFLRITRHREDFPRELQNRPRHWHAVAVKEWALHGAISPQFTQQTA